MLAVFLAGYGVGVPLSVANGNVADAARRLQTDRPNLYRRMKRLGITL